jgi:hypothetical protein
VNSQRAYLLHALDAIDAVIEYTQDGHDAAGGDSRPLSLRGAESVSADAVPPFVAKRADPPCLAVARGRAAPGAGDRGRKASAAPSRRSCRRTRRLVGTCVTLTTYTVVNVTHVGLNRDSTGSTLPRCPQCR